MHDHHDDPVELAKAEKLRYDHRDLDIDAIRKSMFPFGAFLVFCLIASFLVMAGLYWLRQQGESAFTAQVAPPRASLPAGPLLQSDITAKLDMENLRKREDRMANSYGWADRPNGVARIPIDRAVELTAQRGLGVVSQKIQDVPYTPVDNRAPDPEAMKNRPYGLGVGGGGGGGGSAAPGGGSSQTNDEASNRKPGTIPTPPEGVGRGSRRGGVTTE